MDFAALNAAAGNDGARFGELRANLLAEFFADRAAAAPCLLHLQEQLDALLANGQSADRLALLVAALRDRAELLAVVVQRLESAGLAGSAAANA